MSAPRVTSEDGAGAGTGGQARRSGDLHRVTPIARVQGTRRRIEEYAQQKGWTVVRWYEEPEHSAKYEEIEKRPIFARLLEDAGLAVPIVLCYMNNRWVRNAASAYGSLGQLRRKRAWWATADGMWDIVSAS